MPTYEYECLNCGSHFDLFQKMSELPLDKCITCEGSVRRVVSGGSGLIFKGSGFYITDYAKGKSSSSSTSTESADKPRKPATKTSKTETPKSTS